jgi:uncharacterized protein YqeY
MIAKSLQARLGEAMKAHDEIRVSTLRLLISAFNYEQIEKQHELTDEEELVVLRQEAKKRKEAIEMYKKAGAADRAEKEEKELRILQEFLPPEISEEDLAKLVDEAIVQVKPADISGMGKVIGFVKSKAPDADGAKVAELVREKLS